MSYQINKNIFGCTGSDLIFGRIIRFKTEYTTLSSQALGSYPALRQETDVDRGEEGKRQMSNLDESQPQAETKTGLRHLSWAQMSSTSPNAT